MQLVRTTIRLEKRLKKAAERLALKNETTLQEIMNQALKDYLNQKTKKRAKKIIFETIDLGVPLDNLTRSDYYEDPQF